jgi:hypothetical protein
MVFLGVAQRQFHDPRGGDRELLHASAAIIHYSLLSFTWEQGMLKNAIIAQ